MLSDEVIEKVVERLAVRMEQANTYILEKIGKSIKKIGTLTPTQAHQLVQTLQYGGDYDKIVKELARITKLNVADIYEIFKEVAKKDYEFAKQFYDFRNKKYIPWDENKQLQEQVKALAKITANEYINLTKTSAVAFGWRGKDGTVTFKGLKKTYYDLLDEAVLNVGQGKEAFNSAMYRRLKEIGGGGIQVIFPTTYIDKNGVEKNRVMRADSAVRMQMKGALRNMHNEIQQQFGEEFDADGVEISVHLSPAPDHEQVQGRQFSNAEFEKFQNDEDAVSYDGIEFPAEFEGHDRRSISQYNCYHYVFSIVLGVNKPQYSNEQLQDIINKNNEGFEFDGKHYTTYQGTQLQRQIETEIRKQKDTQIMARASGNDELVAESQQKISQLTNKYKQLSEASGLPTAIDRIRVSGYHKVKVKATNETPKPAIKKNNLKANEIFIKANDTQKIDNFFLEYYKNEEHLRPFQKERYNEILERKKQGYKDEKIKLDSIENCNKLLRRINTEIEGNEIKNTDIRLVAEATDVLYNNSLKSPAIMDDLKRNKAYLRAKEDTQGVANTLMNTITLNNKDFSNYDEFKKMSVENTSLHKHFDGKEHSWWSPVAEGNETKEIITHEFGHRLQSEIVSNVYFESGINKKGFEYFFKKYGKTYSNGHRMLDVPYRTIRRDLIYEPIRRLQQKTGMTQKEIIDKYVSMYGKKDYDEMFAETFANSQLGKSNELGDELINFLIELGEWEK